MATFVDGNGFIKKTFEENKEFWETSFQSIFGEEIDLDPSGPFGQLTALLANRDTTLWEGAEEIYNSRDPNAAEGLSLDKIAAETGIIRQSATETVGYNVFLYGVEGTLVEAGKKARQSQGDFTDLDYVLESNVTITKTAAREVELTIQSPSDTELFTITIDTIDYSYTASVPTDTENEVAEALKLAIEAGSFTGTVTRTNATLLISDANTDNNDFNIAWTSNITLDKLASGGVFEAELAGEFPLSSNTLDTIVTPVSGWDEVNNPNSGITGRNTETDEEFRIRRALTLFTGNATDDAITRAISNNVTGITQVSITSNRSDFTSPDGLPPHSFEVVVAGGDDDDIAQQIWETQPSGIQSFGNETIIVQDSEGQDQTIKFSRPTPVYIHVRVSRDLYSEEVYPSDGDFRIKQNIVTWAIVNQPIGKDVIRQRLATPIYGVEGIEDILVELDRTPNPGDTPTFVQDNIVITSNEYADFATARITVQDLTP